MTRTAIVLVLGAMIALSACSASLSVDEYAQAMTTASEAYVVESQNLSFDYQSSVEDGVRAIVEGGADDAADEATDLMRTSTVAYLALLLDAMGRFVDEIDQVVAPSELAGDHEQYVDAVRSVHAAIPPTQDLVRSAGDLTEIERAFSGSAFADGQPRWTATCEVLERAIADAGGTADLRCVRTEPGP